MFGTCWFEEERAFFEFPSFHCFEQTFILLEELKRGFHNPIFHEVDLDTFLPVLADTIES